MKIVIVGAGNAGRNLTKKLCGMGHDVVVIDHDAETLANLSSEVDAMTVEGNGSSPSVLNQVGIAKADLLAAVTSRDEVNILACVCARKAGRAHTIARICEESYLTSPAIDLKQLGVDYALNHKVECAREIFNVFQLPGTLEAAHLLGGRITALGLKLPSASPLLGKPLVEFREEKWFDRIRFIAVSHGGKLEIPKGESQFYEGDDVYVVLDPGDTPGFLNWALNSQKSGFRKVIIAGGGELGLSLAKLLEKTSTEVVLVERDRQRAENAAEHLHKCLVINADIAKAETFKDIGVDAETAFASTTEDEELNTVRRLHGGQGGQTGVRPHHREPQVARPCRKSIPLDGKGDTQICPRGERRGRRPISPDPRRTSGGDHKTWKPLGRKTAQRPEVFAQRNRRGRTTGRYGVRARRGLHAAGK